MNPIIQGAICMIKSAITGLPCPIPEGVPLLDVQKLMLQQRILAMGYIGAINTGYPPENKGMLYLLDQYCGAVLHSERQMAQIARISQAFDQNGIDYMPVKGAIMKAIYPNPELRTMSDADILIREEQYPQIAPIMAELGFQETGESDHEHIWIHEHLKVELHKRLIPTYNTDLYSYFGEGWDLAKTCNGHCWAMSQEDAFIYNFIHFAKHYRDGDVNCRFVIDLWVHRRHCPELDMQYIRRQMEKMKMEVFYDNIMHLLDVWFQDAPWDEKTQRITQVLFNTDAQDLKEVHTIAQNARVAQQAGSTKRLKRTQFWNRVFPSREHMDWSYPKWKKTPLPIAWMLRWGDLLINRRDVIKNRQEEMDSVTEQALTQYRQDLEYVGLQFSDGVALPE